MKIVPAVVTAVVVVGVMGGCGPVSSVSGAAPRGASAAAGDIRITGAYVGDDDAAGYRPVYLTLHDLGAASDLLEAVVAPAAVSTTWTVTHAVHTPAEIAAFAEPCGADPRLLAQSDAELAASSDVLVPARGILQLAPGIGRLQLNGIGALARRAAVAMTLYFASGAVVHLTVPVSGPRQPDPLAG